MQKTLARSDRGYLALTACGHLRLHLGQVTMHLSKSELLEITGMLIHGVKNLSSRADDSKKENRD